MSGVAIVTFLTNNDLPYMIERSLRSYHLRKLRKKKASQTGKFLESTLRKKRNRTFAKNFRYLVKIMNFA